MNSIKQQNECIDIEVDDLVTAEKNINVLIKELQNTKKRLCLILAQIKIDRLYEQIDLESFKEYVTSKRLNISYNTALEYAKIGELLIKYEKQLAEVDFSEEDGFKKLLFLEQALENHNPEEVFKRIKDTSFKNFSKYSQPARAGFAPDALKKKREGTDDKSKTTDPVGRWIFETNGKIYMDAVDSGSELLSFNNRFLEDENLADEYKAFMSYIIVTTMNYFKDKRTNRDLFR